LKDEVQKYMIRMAVEEHLKKRQEIGRGLRLCVDNILQKLCK